MVNDIKTENEKDERDEEKLRGLLDDIKEHHNKLRSLYHQQLEQKAADKALEKQEKKEANAPPQIR